MGCRTLEQLLKHGGRGISAKRIGELIQSIFDLVFLGIYIEMTNTLQDGQPLLFGSMIDLGSKIKKKQSMLV